MKLHKLHEVKTLNEMIGGLDVPMNASPTPGMPNQELGDIKKKLNDLSVGQEQMKMQATSPAMNPAVPQAKQMLGKAAALNTAQAPTPSDQVNKEVHDSSGPRMPTSTF